MRSVARRPNPARFAALLGLAAIGAGQAAAEPPDLRLAPQVDRSLTYNLGATGLRGWIHTEPATFFDSVQGRTSTASRQILVTHVGPGTPADGLLEPGDVILGAGAAAFATDARRAVAEAIQAAEAGKDGGSLRLTRWRAGRVDEVRLPLRMVGAYASTAPFDCPKSRRILDEACAVLAREPLTDDLWGAVSGLALLASGVPEFLPRVAAFARTLARGSEAATRADMRTWECGYRGVFLCEYFLITGDREVLPAIETITRALARGQGMYGTFGHGFAEPAADGGPHGPIPPYGPVNAAGLVANLAIALGRECGVADDEVAAAIDRGSRFFGFYVDKGSIPYGEHTPWPHHDNNGKNAMAALFFAVQGGRPEEARFFARMTTAAYRNREYGHTGQGFSYLWSGPGANVGGPAAAAAHFREVSWHIDLARRCDGSFTYDGGEQYGPGRTDDDSYFGASSYYGLSPTATHVLTYAIPLGRLRITSRGAAAEHQLTADDVAALGPDILAAATQPCPADTMFRNEIRMAAFKALARHRFREGIDAGMTLARTQGGHGSESRTGEIMQALVGYGAAARGVVRRLAELIEFFGAEVAAGGFPAGPLNDRRIDAVRAAIAAIEAAEGMPHLRSLPEAGGDPGGE